MAASPLPSNGGDGAAGAPLGETDAAWRNRYRCGGPSDIVSGALRFFIGGFVRTPRHRCFSGFESHF